MFQLEEHHTSIRREVLAGFTTFSTMVYIVVVNPIIMRQTGMDIEAVMVATILAASLSTLIMAFFANYPFALAPGMGLNAYFAYTLIQEQQLTWQVALGATFIAGILFFLLNVVKLRQLILESIPLSLRLSLTAGIGLFLTVVALSGVGIIVSHPVTLVTAGNLASAEVLMTALGLLITAVLLAKGFGSALLIGILAIWGLSLALGLSEWHGLVALPPSLAPTLWQMDIAGALKPQAISAIIALTTIATFDAAGTFTALAQQGKFLDAQGKLPRARRAFMADAIGTVVGAGMGTSPMTTFLESAAGITAGGRTGLTAVVVALLFLTTLFFAPLIASIPFFATAPALIIIGAQMMKPLANLPFDDLTEWLPGFIMLVAIPLTFSIATGISMGLLFYPLLKLLCGRAREVHWLLWVLAVLFAFQLNLLHH